MTEIIDIAQRRRQVTLGARAEVEFENALALLTKSMFDTFASAAESRRMAGFIGGLADGTIVVAAVRDEAAGQLAEEGVRALASIGAREDLRGRFWASHVVIGVKGAAPGDAVEAAGPQLLRASVGNPPLELVLESFDLR